jgi:hypothetical protein
MDFSVIQVLSPMAMVTTVPAVFSLSTATVSPAPCPGVSYMKIARSFAVVCIRLFAIPALTIALLSAPFVIDVQNASAAHGRRRNKTTKYITGPRGGCYYINSNGKKTYVDRTRCGSSSNGRVTSNGYFRGPRGGCYYINGNGNKTYVDRSLCN